MTKKGQTVKPRWCPGCGLVMLKTGLCLKCRDKIAALSKKT